MIHICNKITSKLATVMVAFDAGSRVERNDYNRGISHMLEHCIFKGTKKRSAQEINREFAFIGASPNAFTSNEMVCYYVTVPYENLDKATEILSDIVFNSEIPEEEFLKEKEVVKEEELSRSDDVDSYMWSYFCKNWFTNHLSEPVIGTQESIDRFSRDEVMSFYKKYCTKSGAIVSIASPMPKYKSKALLSKYFGKPSGKFKKNHILSKSNFKPSFTGRIKKEGIEQTYAWIAHPGLNIGSEMLPSAYVMMSIFGSGMDSRLFSEVREKRGLVYSISSGLQSFEDGSVNITSFSLREKNLDDAIKIVREQAELIKRVPLNEEELERSKNKLKSSFYRINESGYSVAISRLRNSFYGTIPLEQLMSNINDVTSDDVINVANKIFDQDREFVLVCSG